MSLETSTNLSYMGFRNKNPRARKKMWEEDYMGFKIVLGKSDPNAWVLIRE